LALDDGYARLDFVFLASDILIESLPSEQGRDMAQWSVWISVVSILATFDISKSVDEKGVPIEPSGEYTLGLFWWVLNRL
jgi:hypothetical protein